MIKRAQADIGVTIEARVIRVRKRRKPRRTVVTLEVFGRQYDVYEGTTLVLTGNARLATEQS